ncbi:MAG: SRPBCC family protein [Ferrovibrio sp.]|uniref:SRPBCC family protein n=1 Tax=Ferrovibrio sp. TaxID=1917215 RepID=UPI00391CBA42
MDITTEILIDAPPARVWAVLADFATYGAWNPFMPQIFGTPQAGARLRVRIVPPGSGGMTFRPRLLTVTPERELRWRGHLLVPGLFDGEHRFRLEPTDGGQRTLFRHGESFSGLLLPVIFGARAQAATRAGFEAMNAALKRRAESAATA